MLQLVLIQDVAVMNLFIFILIFLKVEEIYSTERGSDFLRCRFLIENYFCIQLGFDIGVTQRL